MITSIFKKSKPINFIIVILSVILLFGIANYESFTTDILDITSKAGVYFWPCFLYLY